ncbi:MAG: hypothetical protein PHQ43_00740 [Dehalococcoidales bacterium]|nr:hypothetical protein [Dehalococcoidales bacterium]
MKIKRRPSKDIVIGLCLMVVTIALIVALLVYDAGQQASITNDPVWGVPGKVQE